jgi:DNA-binding MarR family transcriptional regulator
METINIRLDRALCVKWAARLKKLRRLLKEPLPDCMARKGTGRRDRSALTPEQLAVITILDSAGHGIATGEINEKIDLPYANTTRTLDRMEKRGLVFRSRGKADQRQIIVKLTLEGHKIARHLAETSRAFYASFWDGYTEAEKRMLIELLKRQL